MLHLLVQRSDEAGNLLTGDVLEPFLVGQGRNRIVIPLINRGEHVGDLLLDGLWGDGMFCVVLRLEGSAADGLCQGPLHRAGGNIGVENRLAFDIARGPAHGLDERAGRA